MVSELYNIVNIIKSIGKNINIYYNNIIVKIINLYKKGDLNGTGI